MKKSRPLGAVCALILVVLSPIVSASLVVPAGLNPGDTFHVIFVTSTTTDATSSDINTYDAFVQSAADAAGIGTTIGVGWLALGSTTTIDAYDHLSPLFSNLSAPIYNQNGELVASGYADMWDGALNSAVAYTENASYRLSEVWTGSHQTGIGSIGYELGTSYVTDGTSTTTDQDWIQATSENATNPFSLYAISQQLVVTPSGGVAPAAVPVLPTAWLFGSGLLGLIAISRRKILA